MVLATEPYLPLQVGGLGLIAVHARNLLVSARQATARIDKKDEESATEVKAANEARVSDLRAELERVREDLRTERHKREAADRALSDCWRRHYGVEPPEVH